MGCGWWQKFYSHTFSWQILALLVKWKKQKFNRVINNSFGVFHLLLDFTMQFARCCQTSGLHFRGGRKSFVGQQVKHKGIYCTRWTWFFHVVCESGDFSAAVVKRKRASRPFAPSQSLFWQEQLLASARDSDDWLTSIFIKSLSYSRVVGSARVSKEISLSWDVVTKDFSPAPERVGF